MVYFTFLIFNNNGLDIIPNTSCEAQPYLNVDMKIINFYSGSAVIPPLLNSSKTCNPCSRKTRLSHDDESCAHCRK